jgi:hypothetical protein
MELLRDLKGKIDALSMEVESQEPKAPPPGSKSET